MSSMNSYSQLKRIPLTDWTFRNAKDMQYMPAGVPGTVHTDLLANGVDGIHLYTMNQPDIAKRISENIRGILYSLRVKRG